MSNQNNIVEIPKVFSMQRLVELSDAEMDNVAIFEKGGRTVKSHLSLEEQKKLKEGEEDNLQDKIVNLYYGEVAKATDDEVIVSFDMKINHFENNLTQINDVNFYEIFKDKINTQNPDILNALKKISKYIAYNIMNGRWLWRNKAVADKITLDVDGFILDNIMNIPNDIVLDKNNEIAVNLSEEEKVFLDRLAEKIYNGWTNNGATFKVKAILKVSKNRNIYPSELFEPNPKKLNAKTDMKMSKTYFRTPEGKPAITFEKVWNAIRTFDVWHLKYQEVKEPISIELKGGTLKFLQMFRNSKTDFRHFLLEYLSNNKLKEEDLLYMVSCIIRGGMLATEKESNKSNDNSSNSSKNKTKEKK